MLILVLKHVSSTKIVQNRSLRDQRKYIMKLGLTDSNGSWFVYSLKELTGSFRLELTAITQSKILQIFGLLFVYFFTLSKKVLFSYEVFRLFLTD